MPPVAASRSGFFGLVEPRVPRLHRKFVQTEGPERVQVPTFGAETMTDITTITEPAANERARNGSVILTDRIKGRTKVYDRKCPGLYVSITVAGSATFSFKFTDPDTASCAPAGSASTTRRPSQSSTRAARSMG